MPRVAKELSALDVKRLSHPGDKGNVTFAVGGVSGLLMQITPGGAKMWILRAAIGAKRREIGLGRYPDVTLAQARDRAREARDMIWRGVDPIEDRKARRAAVTAAQLRGKTFAQTIDGYCKAKLEEIGNEKDRKRWRSAVERFTLPHIGNLLVNDLTVQDMLRVLEPIWIEKTESARKLRNRIENIIAWATVAGHRTGENPARWKGNLDTLLPKPGKIADRKNHPAIALGDAAAWSSALRERRGTAARALEFLLLCASRSGEVRGATWDEVDLQARIWTISSDRMKAEREHRVPLTDRAIEIIEAMPRLGESPYIFAAPREGMLSDATLSAVMRRMQADAENKAKRAGLPAEKAGWRDARTGVPAVPHGLRSTFRDWAAERTGFPREMAEIALAHSVGSEVERAYRRSDMIEKRRAMMAAWADFLTGEGPAGNNVVRIG